MPALKTFVIQYPPGTGLVMAMFPPGHQVVPLYSLASIRLFGFALLATVLCAVEIGNVTCRRLRMPCCLPDDQSVESEPHCSRSPSWLAWRRR
jgi:hypothetical protein